MNFLFFCLSRAFFSLYTVRAVAFFRLSDYIEGALYLIAVVNLIGKAYSISIFRLWISLQHDFSV